MNVGTLVRFKNDDYGYGVAESIVGDHRGRPLYRVVRTLPGGRTCYAYVFETEVEVIGESSEKPR